MFLSFLPRKLRWEIHFAVPWHTYVCRWSPGIPGLPLHQSHAFFYLTLSLFQLLVYWSSFWALFQHCIVFPPEDLLGNPWSFYQLTVSVIYDTLCNECRNFTLLPQCWIFALDSLLSYRFVFFLLVAMFFSHLIL